MVQLNQHTVSPFFPTMAHVYESPRDIFMHNKPLYGSLRYPQTLTHELPPSTRRVCVSAATSAGTRVSAVVLCVYVCVYVRVFKTSAQACTEQAAARVQPAAAHSLQRAQHKSNTYLHHRPGTVCCRLSSPRTSDPAAPAAATAVCFPNGGKKKNRKQR